ncbi:MAG: dephospho-CoA kinase [Dysgonamonadaceae bacterium]|jgi:dephospho-CoA kinase|nr:dephospho-CoA kinase [Dysgonamonadaceae bacterium]
MVVIGLTGGIGSGKSTVSRLLETMEIPVYVADVASKKLMDESAQIREILSEKFGSELYRTGKLNRSLLASLIFGNEENLLYVNSLIHPLVWKDFQNWANQHSGKKCLAIESAILFESGFSAAVDVKVNVSAPLELRIQRVENRDNTEKELIIKRINSQLSEEERNRLSDFTILNDNVNAIIPQIEILMKILKFEKNCVNLHRK